MFKQFHETYEDFKVENFIVLCAFLIPSLLLSPQLKQY